MDTAWMNWDGWRWIAPFLGLAIGFYFGWDTRGWRERHKRMMRETEDILAWRAENVKPKGQDASNNVRHVGGVDVEEHDGC